MERIACRSPACAGFRWLLSFVGAEESETRAVAQGAFSNLRHAREARECTRSVRTATGAAPAGCKRVAHSRRIGLDRLRKRVYTPDASDPKPHSPRWLALRPSLPPPAKQSATGSTAAATASSTALSIRSRSHASATTQRPNATPPDAPPKARHPEKIRRCLKRHLARRLYRILQASTTTAGNPTLVNTRTRRPQAIGPCS